MIPGRPGADPSRTGKVRRQDAAQGRLPVGAQQAFQMGRLERQHLTVGGDQGLKRRDADARLGRQHQVLGRIVDDLIERGQA